MMMDLNEKIRALFYTINKVGTFASHLVGRQTGGAVGVRAGFLQRFAAG